MPHKHTPQSTQPELPYPKLCECGCGQPAPIAKITIRRRGQVKGQPVRFIKGHRHRVRFLRYNKEHFQPYGRVDAQEPKTIALTQGKVTSVDVADYEWLSQWSWHAYICSNGICYAHRNSSYRNGKRHHIFMHRVIADAPDDMDVDHRDGNGLNNTHANLRLCTASQNTWNRQKPSNNTSGFKGVTWRKDRGKWAAAITHNSTRIFLGCFLDVTDAAKAYDEKAKELFGEFARLNFP